jgi:hypothetical protein
MEHEIYEEKVSTYAFLNAILIISLIIILAIVILMFTGRMEGDNVSKAIILIVFFFDLFVVLSMRELTITITDKQLVLAFGKMRKKIWLKKITKIENAKYQFGNYLGYGIRFGRDGTIGYAPRGGDGLIITAEGLKKKYFFVSNRRDELKALLEQQSK